MLLFFWFVYVKIDVFLLHSWLFLSKTSERLRSLRPTFKHDLNIHNPRFYLSFRLKIHHMKSLPIIYPFPKWSYKIKAPTQVERGRFWPFTVAALSGWRALFMNTMFRINLISPCVYCLYMRLDRKTFLHVARCTNSVSITQKHPPQIKRIVE